jgi:hypothetical protein
LPRGPGKKRDQEDRGARRKERSRGLPRVPAEKRVQQDRVGQKEERPRGLPRGPGEKRDQDDRGDQQDGGEKERETKRIARGARRMEEISRYGGARMKEGPRGLPRVPAEKRDQED